MCASKSCSHDLTCQQTNTSHYDCVSSDKLVGKAIDGKNLTMFMKVFMMLKTYWTHITNCNTTQLQIDHADL